MDAKFTKTSNSRACECKPFIHVFMIFRLIENMEIILQIYASHIKSWESNILSKAQAPLQQVRPQHETHGGMEKKEWENRGIGENLTIWYFNMQLIFFY